MKTIDPQTESQALDDISALAMQKTTVMLSLPIWMAFCTLGALQLAFRHPDFTGPSREEAEKAARKLQKVISVTDALAAVAEAGWDPDYDTPPEIGLP